MLICSSHMGKRPQKFRKQYAILNKGVPKSSPLYPKWASLAADAEMRGSLPTIPTHPPDS